MFHLKKYNKAISLLGCFIWLFAALFFLYEFFLRVFVGTIADELTHTLHFSAEQLSLIGAAYFWTYGLMQLPVGILVDQFRIRVLLTFASLTCVLGVFLFAYSHTFALIFISRLLMGLGSSFGFVCLLQISLNWFSHQHFGFLSGLSQLLGAAGPVLAGAPLVYFLYFMQGDWHRAMIDIGFAGLVLSVLIWTFVRAKPKVVAEEVVFLHRKMALIQHLLGLFKNIQVWIIVLYSVLVNTALAFLGIVWGTPYLETRQMNLSTASFICSLIWVGYAIGSPIFGFISDRIKRRNPLLIIPAALGIFSALSLIYCSFNHYILFVIIFLFFGMASAGQSLAFAIISEHVQTRTQASAFGLNNACILLSTSMLIPLFGFLIESAGKENAIVYQQQDFTNGLVILLCSYILAFLLSLFFVKETYCRQQSEPVWLDKIKKER